MQQVVPVYNNKTKKPGTSTCIKNRANKDDKKKTGSHRALSRGYIFNADHDHFGLVG